MKEYVLPALLDNCQAFAEDLAKQQNGKLEKDTLFLWNSFFANSDNEGLAVEFTQTNPNCTDAELDKLDKFIADAKEKNIKPTRCITLGCNEEQIAQCHKKILTNANGEPSNSPAFFIREDNLKKYKAREEFNAIKDEVFEKIASGDTSAHMDEDFIKAAANLKASDSLAFTKLKEELKEMNAKIAAFDEEVGKLSKSKAK